MMAYTWRTRELGLQRCNRILGANEHPFDAKRRRLLRKNAVG